MNGYRCVVPVTARFRDCDPLGHVNNAVYLTYLEEARFRWFREVFGEGGFAMQAVILADAKCSFRASAKPGDELEIGIRVERIGRTSFTHGYRLERVGDRALIADAETVAVGYDYEKGATRELGDAFRRAVETYQGTLPRA